MYVLIVDDDVGMTQLLTRGFARVGRQTISVTSAADALEEIRSAPDDIWGVVTDYHLRGMNGAQLAVEIRRLIGVPVILLTGDDDLSGVDRSMFDRVMVKPADLFAGLVADIEKAFVRE